MALPDCMMPDGAEPCGAYRALQAELARVREDLKAWERNCASLIAHRDEALEKVERMALRAAQIISENSHEFGAREITPDEAVAQAMREGGESRPVRHALNCSGYYGNEPCDCGAQ